MQNGTCRRLKFRLEVNIFTSAERETLPRTDAGGAAQPIAVATSAAVVPDIEMYEPNPRFATED
jgi:hypothetical protein